MSKTRRVLSGAADLLRKFGYGLLALVWVTSSLWMPSSARAADPTQGPGGPILVITSGTSNFGNYYAEILRNEGFNEFAVADIANVTASTLAAYDLAIVAKMPLTATQSSMLSTWVNGGGNLIAMAPDAKLAGLLGVTPLGTTLTNAYLLVDTSVAPGSGIINQTLQFHGSADLYTLSGATQLAALYSNASTATSNPATTLRSAGSGQAAAFTFDLATSVVYSRQGNPAWAAQERDGFSPIRSDDKFFGNAANDPQPDWIDLSKVGIPQADEQQRFLANLITLMNAAKRPLPRFWYFPNGKKAVVLMSGDDHGNGGTSGRFDSYLANSVAGCAVANWECVRATSYVYPGTPITDTQAAQYTAQGFEISLHINTSCSDFTRDSLDAFYTDQLNQWHASFPSLPGPFTMRHHCIVWSDWNTAADIELKYGMRLDASYYFWPPGWVNDVPGNFTASAMPMRLMRLDGTYDDVYEAVTQMTDESGQTYPNTVDTLLSRAVGAEGYYGVYTVNAHTDTAASDVSDAVVASAQSRGVPIVSARQMLTWLDARNASSFSSIVRNGGTLNFTIQRDSNATGLQAMLPLVTSSGTLSALTRAGTGVSFTPATVKGVQYAFFSGDSGAYVATYSVDSTPPTVTSTSPASGATGVSVNAAISATFSEDLNPSTVSTATFDVRAGSGPTVAATVSYNAGTRTAILTPSVALAGTTTYTATLHGGTSGARITDVAGNALASNFTWNFTTGNGTQAPTCPCQVWPPNTVPPHPSINDSGAVEVGVKFTSDFSGFISGIRFYKGTGNTGTHIGNLWTLGGTRLGTATFTGETATGWQQVNFATPVAISANTVYVASYYAPNGHYAGENNFFASAGVDAPPIHLLRNGVSGGNGVYSYGSTSTFPSSTYQASNYWVDVVFTTVDTTPPTVTSTSPANGATGVGITTAVTATFSEALDPTTVNASTFDLRTSSNALVAASISYDAGTQTATLTPTSALANSATYTATLHGGTTDPRIKDLAGNALAANSQWTFTTAAPGTGCANPANPIVAENCLTGNSSTEWDVNGAGDASIQGFATQISVNRGSTVTFKVDTNAGNYRFDIYRMGYYNGAGARKIASVNPSASLPQNQPDCLTDAPSGLVDCGNWAVSGSWNVPATATSGIYFARLVRADTGGASHVFFVVRDDSSTADVLYQTSDTTWEAYNEYGGNSLYTGGPGTNPGRAYKVSYNRPFTTRSVSSGQDWVFNAEYPMVRWLEANGYNVAYASGVDTDRAGAILLNHKVFLSSGHDEYWSGTQRANVEAARNAGVSLAFFSGNESFWKTRWENSIDGTGTAYRTLVCYKETHANAKIDPQPVWTGTWRDPRFSPPYDGGRPENSMTGTIFMNNDTGTPYSITVPAVDGKMRLWRNTTVATLAVGQTATLPIGTLGYEFDADLDNGARPPGLVRQSTTTLTTPGVLQDYGSTYGNGTVTHSLTFYKHSSGARVFGAGTIQWAWGLDSHHDRGNTAADVRMQQATVNLLADMLVQPATLQAGLVAATASSDVTAPTSVISSPTNGSTVTQNTMVTVSGTAADTGGQVGSVEVSTDGGTTWHPASGRATWTYGWTPNVLGSATIQVRAVDDSGNIQSSPASVSVTVVAASCPCSIWPASASPTNPADPDRSVVNLGVKFRSDQSGRITGIRFYKSTTNTGTHVGALWTSGGQLLASATFTNESASGWQQVSFTTPVAITANTVYVASYRAPSGHYAGDNGYFATSGFDSGPLHALQDGVSGGNGVYAYGGTSPLFPSSTYQASNYWVDVVFVSP
jgi:hypothetical protein